MSKYRYPGVKPFETSETNLFFGRDRDLNDLYRLISLEKLVVLFGKSGYGKSSLLNAGIIPRFTSQPMEQESDSGEIQKITFLPIVVRFGNYIGQQSSRPLINVQEKIIRHFPLETEEGGFMDNFPEKNDASLWFACKRRGVQHLAFIFDQFEEFFSYPAEQQYAFRIQMAELLYTRIPQTIRDRWSELGKTEKSYLSRPMDVKAVFAIRADRMSELDRLSEELSAILHKRYELKALSLEQAREAVVRPAALPQSDGFVSPSFRYEPAALQRMYDELSGSNTSKGNAGQDGEQGTPRIEAFQLQVLCQYFEQAVIKGRITGTVKPSDLPDIAHIFEAYYKSQLSQLPRNVQPAARAIIEEGLLYDDPATGEARRLSVDADQLIQQFRARGATQELLKQLENTFLLRREANNLGRYNYEISHDTLVAPIVKNKRAHEAERKQKEAEEKAREAEEKARAEQARAEEMERLKVAAETNAGQAQISRQRAENNARRANLVAALAVGLALAALNFWFVSQQAQKVAQDNEQLAKANAAQADSMRMIALKERNAALLSDSSAQANAAIARKALAQQIAAEQKAKQEQLQKYLTEARNFQTQKRFADAVKSYQNALDLVDTQQDRIAIDQSLAQCRADESRNSFERSRDLGLSMQAANDCVGALRYLRKAQQIEPGDALVIKAIRECGGQR